MKIHPQTIIIFKKHLIITFYLVLPLLAIQKQSSVTSKTPLITKEGSTSINPIPEFTIGSASPDGQNLNIDPISEKLRFKILKTTFYKIFAKVL